jgi:hypothetical protein
MVINPNHFNKVLAINNSDNYIVSEVAFWQLRVRVFASYSKSGGQNNPIRGQSAVLFDENQ